MNEAHLLAYLNGELSEHDAEEVEKWVAQAEENRRSLEQIYHIAHLADAAAAYEEADVEAAIRNFRDRVHAREEGTEQPVALPAPQRSWWRRYGVAAAAFFTGIIFASSVLLGFMGDSSVYEVSTLPQQRARVILPDGTAVWLNSSTALTYKGGGLFGQRQAYLKGEAYFEVKRRAARPFVVNARGVRTEVLGTKFNVRARSEEKQVVTTLFQGSVHMYHRPDDQAGTRLTPGQTFCMDVESGRSGVYVYSRPEEVLLWIKGELRFTNEPLGKIMECLSKVYNVHIHFADPALKEKRFTCLFNTDNSLNEILSALSLTRHFGYELADECVQIHAPR